ncbi:MAG: hypothetical protein DLM67_15200 [Candidatus Nephthysia bennettiae]|uniref:N-acetyltransferase domain-containing protein n=1 Tax=Candidatus Nephthysia bennettiae TaxID=3127016 RepID=A0A934N4Y3_9BACT|nr:hypothetical protein [Candidatus Dormibacteraeota bacterium]MBJ7613720.1 hypothetical protein [Candidatus Dormibacteraeota bacterium]PZR92215.1 MAG: hypothetical protein DLM67_15200 [Candidatus Dormibacteraeota bacterium]
MSTTVRRASSGDIEAMLELAEAHRRQYAALHPQFHRSAQDAREVQRPYFEKLISSDSFIVLIGESPAGAVEGFLTGQLMPPPPVYDPGGPGCIVDDFAIRRREDWPTIGRDLLEELRSIARGRGAVQVIVVCAPEDGPKRRMLAEANLAVVSEWHVGEL